MKKLPLCVTAIIFTHFALKIVRKLKQPEQVTKEEVCRRMRDEHESLRASARQIIAKLDAISTHRDGEKWMASIGTMQQMRDALRPSPGQADAMAMAPGRFS